MKMIYTSPRCNLDDQQIFPEKAESLRDPEDRWKYLSEQAGSHRQERSVLQLSRRQMVPQVLRMGVTPQTANRILELHLEWDDKIDVLPEWLDVVSSFFFNLEHLYLDPVTANGYGRNKRGGETKEESVSKEEVKQSKKLRRLYILYRLPNLLSIDGSSVTKKERQLARPDNPNGHRVKREDWFNREPMLDNDDKIECEKNGSRGKKIGKGNSNDANNYNCRGDGVATQGINDCIIVTTNNNRGTTELSKQGKRNFSIQECDKRVTNELNAKKAIEALRTRSSPLSSTKKKRRNDVIVTRNFNSLGNSGGQIASPHLEVESVPASAYEWTAVCGSLGMPYLNNDNICESRNFPCGSIFHPNISELRSKTEILSKEAETHLSMDHNKHPNQSRRSNKYSRLLLEANKQKNTGDINKSTELLEEESIETREELQPRRSYKYSNLLVENKSNMEDFDEKKTLKESNELKTQLRATDENNVYAFSLYVGSNPKNVHRGSIRDGNADEVARTDKYNLGASKSIGNKLSNTTKSNDQESNSKQILVNSSRSDHEKGGTNPSMRPNKASSRFIQLGRASNSSTGKGDTLLATSTTNGILVVSQTKSPHCIPQNTKAFEILDAKSKKDKENCTLSDESKQKKSHKQLLSSYENALNTTNERVLESKNIEDRRTEMSICETVKKKKKIVREITVIQDSVEDSNQEGRSKKNCAPKLKNVVKSPSAVEMRKDKNIVSPCCASTTDVTLPPHVRRLSTSNFPFNFDESKAISSEVDNSGPISPVFRFNALTKSHENLPKVDCSISSNQKLPPSKSLSSPFPMQFRKRGGSPSASPEGDLKCDEQHASDSDSSFLRRTTLKESLPPLQIPLLPSPTSSRSPMETIESPVPLARTQSSPSKLTPPGKKTASRGDLPPPCPNARRKSVVVHSGRAVTKKKSFSRWKNRRSARSISIMDDEDEEEEESSSDEEDDILLYEPTSSLD